MVFVLDVSGSMQVRVGVAQRRNTTFLQHILWKSPVQPAVSVVLDEV